METHLTGIVEKIIFSDGDGFIIAVLKNGEKISGIYDEMDTSNLINTNINLTGKWEEHKKYGKTFKFSSIIINENELFFFLNRIIKGFTKQLSQELIEHFGSDKLVEILDNDIKQLLSFKDIKEKRLVKIQTSWKKFRSMKTFGEFLSPYGVSSKLLTIIANGMKDVENPIDKIRDNPYILTSINNIGFKRADELALKMGISIDDEKRIASAMDYLLFSYCEAQGNSCLDKNVFFNELDILLEFSSKQVLYENVLTQMVIDGSIVLMNENRLSPVRLYNAEKFLYDNFKQRVKLNNGGFVDNLDKFLEDSSLILGDEQREAVLTINSGSNILFLAGYAGTGKSTTSKTILELLKLRYDEKDIITCALSGIASQRISDTTGFEGMTIQSLLVKHEESDIFPYKVVLIDEASMINSMLFAKLMKKIDKNAIVIIVGDDAQLPPIGAGNILSDMLKLNFVPIVKLTKIYRQNEQQAIAIIANEIRKGQLPSYNQKYDDFEFIDVSVSNYYMLKNTLSQDELKKVREDNSSKIIVEILYKVVESIKKARYRLNNKLIKEYLNYFQVITPMKGGILGVNNLNKILQEYFNPKPSKRIKIGDDEFRLMDKVVHIKNENMQSWNSQEFKDNDDARKRRIFNGMSGLLFRIDEDEEHVFVFYPNEDIVVLYEYDEIKNYLTLSYALTIHKVQGMEYDIVVMPISFSHYIMHNTKLIYTAITRAKHRCILVGESNAFEMACKRFDVTKRDTVLLEIGND